MPILGAFIVPHPPLIIPEVGKGQEKTVQRTIDSYRAVGHKIAALKPDTIVVISPHSIIYDDYIHISPGDYARGDLRKFGVPDVAIRKKYDSAFIKTLSDAAVFENIAAGTLGEKSKVLDHGVLVPLYFIEQHYKDYELVRISISGLSFLEHYKFGRCIRQAAEVLDRKIVIIASGDLSHKLKDNGPYSFAKEGPEFDEKVVNAMSSGNFMDLLTFSEDFCDAAGECGLRSIIEMAGALDEKSIQPEFLSYEGPFGVGYAVCCYKITGNDKSRNFGKQHEKSLLDQLEEIKRAEDEYVRLARLSLETYVKTRNPLKRPADLPEEIITNKAGVFVSIKKDGSLRGCMGTISPTTPSIADEIIHNAISAGTDDPRFAPVAKNELPYLIYSVDVMEKPESIASIDKLDVKKYGVIVTSGARRGLLLPNLEGINSPEQQVSIALQKAGISSHEKYSMERFKVVRHT